MRPPQRNTDSRTFNRTVPKSGPLKTQTLGVTCESSTQAGVETGEESRSFAPLSMTNLKE